MPSLTPSTQNRASANVTTLTVSSFAADLLAQARNLPVQTVPGGGRQFAQSEINVQSERPILLFFRQTRRGEPRIARPHRISRLGCFQVFAVKDVQVIVQC